MNPIYLTHCEPISLAQAREEYPQINGWNITSQSRIQRLADKYTGNEISDNRELSAQLQSILLTLKYGRNAGSDIEHYLKSPNVLSTEDLFRDRLTVMSRIIDRFEEVNNYARVSEGKIFNPEAGRIVNFQTTRYFWIGPSLNGLSYEALIDTEDPDGSKIAIHSMGEENVYQTLKQEHENRNLFAKGSIDAVMMLYYGYHVPILGISEISNVNFNGNVETLNKNGVQSWTTKQDRHQTERIFFPGL